MCGLAGIVGSLPPGEACLEELRRMAAMLAHRGPDGVGFYRDDRAGLAHTRLSIIDLEGGAQPLCNEDGTLWVAFNGEIFNYVELRAELVSAGHVFATRSDTEVIVHAFEEWGDRAWRKLNGQFAIALWDRRQMRLYLVRDRMGILPLFYARAGDSLVFASEVKAILASGRVAAEFDPSNLVQLFSLWSVPAPATLFRGVQSVPPGTVLSFDAQLRVHETRYWTPNLEESESSQHLSIEEAAEELRALLTRAVEIRLRADVPVGAYLSGGLDSSVIANLVRSVDSSPLETFAIGFEDQRFDETAHQERMAQFLGTRHRKIMCGAGHLRDCLPDVIWHTETALMRTAPAPLFHLSGLVRSTRRKVVLTGEGADELLAGYGIFKEDRVRRFWARRPESDMRPSLLSRVYPYVRSGGAQRDRVWESFFRHGLTDVEHPYYSHRMRWRNAAWTTRFLAPEVRECVEEGATERVVDGLMPSGWRAWEPLARAQAIEWTTFLTPYLLPSQGDRVAMANGVEVRYPFLDPDVVDFCAGLPRRLKLTGLRDKVVLRRLASRDLPEAIWSRPKQPYRAPMTAPFFGPDAPEYVEELLATDALQRTGLLDPDRTRRLATKARRSGGELTSEREEMALMLALTLQLLSRQYLSEFRSRVDACCEDLGSRRPSVLEDWSSASAGGSSPRPPGTRHSLRREAGEERE